MYNLVAPCLFGLESLVADELKQMGAENVSAQNGRVLFTGDDRVLVRANLWSRYAERIQISLGSFTAKSFSELFDNVKKIPFEKYIEVLDAFPVKGWSVNSALHSIPDCQSIIKKAIVNRLAEKYKVSWFQETGVKKQISFSILKDNVTLTLETSGEGLHKRGYRKNSNDAPIKETLAAAMVKLARIYDDSVVYDPFCGSGTILIEAALMAKNIAPGLRRGFAAEKYHFIDSTVWQSERARAQDMINHDIPFRAVGSDIDKTCVELTLENAQKAGVAKCFDLSVADIKDFSLTTPRAIVITNPPYGERMLDTEKARKIEQTMGKVFIKQKGYRYIVISQDEEFEKQFGRTADKRRKLYNGNLKCQLYMYFKV